MWFTTTSLLSLFLIGLIYFWKDITSCFARYSLLLKIPGPESSINFLLGNVLYFRTDHENMLPRLSEACEKYYPIFNIHTMLTGSAALISPEDCEQILSNPIHNTKSLIYDLLHNWLADGLVNSTGNKWQQRRRILTPAFHFNILQQFINIFNEEAQELVQMLKANETVNITPLVTQYTLKAIAETAMGTKLNLKTGKDLTYKNSIHELAEVLLYRFLNPWFIFTWINYLSPRYLKERAIIKSLQQYTRKLINEREKNFDNNNESITEYHDVYTGKKRLAMLDLLIAAKLKNEINDDGIQEEVDTFMFGGHDTTAMGLSFCLMLLANHMDCQKLILEEMELVMGDVKKKPSYTDLQNLKYMERCIKESLRLYPSVYLIGRNLGEDVHTHSGYLLPRGTNVSIVVYGMHHNSRIYPDPEKFDPDRFLPENCQQRHPFAYLPFSAGSRNCIGQKFAILELKAAICAVLSNYELHPVDTPDTIILLPYMVLRPKNGIKIKFVPHK